MRGYMCMCTNVCCENINTTIDISTKSSSIISAHALQTQPLFHTQRLYGQRLPPHIFVDAHAPCNINRAHPTHSIHHRNFPTFQPPPPLTHFRPAERTITNAFAARAFECEAMIFARTLLAAHRAPRRPRVCPRRARPLRLVCIQMILL